MANGKVNWLFGIYLLIIVLFVVWIVLYGMGLVIINGREERQIELLEQLVNGSKAK